jgi:hypothetical protein
MYMAGWWLCWLASALPPGYIHHISKKRARPAKNLNIGRVGHKAKALSAVWKACGAYVRVGGISGTSLAIEKGFFT